MTQIQEVLSSRYIPYAISVIMSRAIPDARDGLKPAQRRILYAMFHDLDLQPEGRYRKSSAIVGQTLARYHPHGDSSAYETMVRMSQDFSQRYPLVDGQGNFGTIDGDSAASARYTEAKLHKNAHLLMSTEGLQEVARTANYDNTTTEPLVLPSEVPMFLLNGALGIAVGMATNTPSHHLGEVVDLLVQYIKRSDMSLEDMLEVLKGPDFPTGGRILISEDARRTIYGEGQGSFTLQGRYKIEVATDKRKGDLIVFHEIPYGVVKSDIVTKMNEILWSEAAAQTLFTSVRDESSEDMRLVFELKRDVNPEIALAYIFEKTALEVKFHANMTALAPDLHTGNLVSKKMGLPEILRAFVDHRLNLELAIAQRKLDAIRKRLHVLDGLLKVLDHRPALYDLLQKADSRKMLVAGLLADPFGLDSAQADYVLGLRIPALSKMDEDALRGQIRDLSKEASELESNVNDPDLKQIRKIWIKRLHSLREVYGDDRRTVIDSLETTPVRKKVDLEALASEDVYIILTQQGWIRAQKSLPDIEKTRVREDDTILQVLKANTADFICFWSSKGKHFTRKVSDITITSGFGDPISKLLTIEDGEAILHASVKGSPSVLILTEGGHTLRLDPATYLEKASRVSGKAFYKGEDSITAVYDLSDPLPQWWIGITTLGRLFTGKVEKIKPDTAYASKGRNLVRLVKGESWVVFGFESVVYKDVPYNAVNYRGTGVRGMSLGLYA